MKLLDSAKTSYKALQTHKLRSFLTILGIVIGITSVVIVFSAGEGFERLIIEQTESWGTDFLEVEIKVPSTSQASMENAGGIAMGINITTLKEDDADAVLKHPNINDVYSGILGQSLITYANEKDTVNLFGITSSYINIDAGEVAEGRFISNEEDKSLAKVIVLGSKLKNKLFGESDAIGKYVKLSRSNYKVIGVMEERGAVMFMDMDEWAFIPLRTLQKLVMGIDHIMFIMADFKDPSLYKPTSEDITLLMRDRHNITDPNKDDFAVTTMAEAREMMETIFGGITLLLVALVGISLIVGGVGIMNIMYVSVSERINEIGLRKAVGANKNNILLQFLVEAIILTFTGGLIGIILGVLISYLISIIAASQGFEWPFVIQPMSLVVAVGFSVAIGLIFGIYPARKASKMDPITALRAEH